jgi:hypothetical protein
MNLLGHRPAFCADRIKEHADPDPKSPPTPAYMQKVMEDQTDHLNNGERRVPIRVYNYQESTCVKQVVLLRESPQSTIAGGKRIVKKLTLLASLVVLMVLFVAVGNAMAAPPLQEAEGVAVEELEVPFLDEWLSSAHADSAAEAFIHWDEDDPAEVPTRCAKCHSTPGYQDFLGADESEPGVVDAAAPIGSVIECVACHNDETLTKTSVVMPSGIELTDLGDESRCMECHQGRQSKVSVDNAIAEAGAEDPDAINEDLGFLNIHYYAAAATKYGTLAKGGYEYDSMSYDANFAHVDDFNTCIECHAPHSLELNLDGCVECHADVTEVEDLRTVRMAGSLVDYDGDGDTDEGIYDELGGLQEMLYATMQAYAVGVTDTPIAYESHSYPYFFIDTNGDGVAEGDETERANGYNAWTPRLLKAAYNYQVSLKDPGAYAHGGKYIIQLLHDSIADLNSAIEEPIDMADAHRIDAGHFAGSEEAFRHWDEDGVVPGSCAKCHSDTGLPTFLAEGVNISVEPSNGFTCTTCHDDLTEYTRYEVPDVTFPSGATVSAENVEDNLCMTCHQGRESGSSVNALIGDAPDDDVADNLRFLNIHYFAAGATRYGSEAGGGYEYDGNEYAGLFDHANVNSCTDCHGAHSLEVDWETCVECHEEVEQPEDLGNIRYYFTDWDGDGDDEEGVAAEITTMREMLYTAMQEYAAANDVDSILYSSAAYPYYFIDTDGDGEAGEGEVNYGNRYASWTPRLLRAAYNYQYASKDPGAFVHNAPYIIQILHDSLEDLGVDVSDLTRP